MFYLGKKIKLELTPHLSKSLPTATSLFMHIKINHYYSKIEVIDYIFIHKKGFQF